MKNLNLTILALLISLTSFAQIGSISGSLTVCVGSTTTLSCTPPGGSWASSNPSVATVGSTGIVTGVSAGLDTITYFAIGTFTTAVVTVNPTPNLSCGSTGLCSVCAGDSIQIFATIAGGTWTSSTPGVGTVGSSSGWVAGITGGTTTITYTLPTGCFATAVVTVNPPPIPYCVTGGCTYCAGGPGCTIGLSNSQVGVNYTLYNGATLMAGPVSGTGSALSFGPQTLAGTYYVVATNTSTGCFDTTTCNTTIVVNPVPVIMYSGTTGGVHLCAGSSLTLTGSPSGGVWSSGNPSIATVGSSSGIVNGISPGVTTISYTVGGCTGTISVTVNANPTISGTLTVCVGATTTLTGSPGGGTWSSGTPAVGTISGAGVITGITAGTTVITYTAPTGCVSMVTVTVNALPTISGATTVCISSSTTLTGSPSGGTWASSNLTVATVGASSGVVTGLTPGTTVITYTAPNGCTKSITVTVVTAPAPISCPSSGIPGCAVCVLGTITLTDATPGGTWSSSNVAIATVGSSTGVVTGVSAGVVTITYSLGGGCFTTITITVNPLPLPISGPNTVCAGFNITLSDGSPGGTWSTSGGNATVGPTSGVVTGVTAGVAIITYTLPTGCSTSYTVTVNPIPCPTLGVNEQTIKTGIQLFPNPAHEELTIQMSEEVYNSFVITNNIGQALIQKPLTDKATTINIKVLPQGIYYIIFRGDQGVAVKRFVKD